MLIFNSIQSIVPQNPWGITVPNPASTQMQPSSASNPWNTSAPTQQIQSNPWGAPTQATTAQNVWGAPSVGNDTTNKPFNPFD
ncbi:MAG: hypothetical protein EZS28_014678 [Streblomastix strix]|uniref:Uncharacterized protein n=1 Tax=Streblomastix strix TaxID=222440 RepID=A0A5J4W477_9EUKA|nr:MAG: hypothetical protein EZS28_014678 [Streblomastix strix]